MATAHDPEGPDNGHLSDALVIDTEHDDRIGYLVAHGGPYPNRIRRATATEAVRARVAERDRDRDREGQSR